MYEENKILLCKFETQLEIKLHINLFNSWYWLWIILQNNNLELYKLQKSAFILTQAWILPGDGHWWRSCVIWLKNFL